MNTAGHMPDGLWWVDSTYTGWVFSVDGRVSEASAALGWAVGRPVTEVALTLLGSEGATTTYGGLERP